MTLPEVCREFDLMLVVLYGSQARGHARPDSDSDVGVLRRSGLVPAEQFLDLLGKLEEAVRRLPRYVELVSKYVEGLGAS